MSETTGTRPEPDVAESLSPADEFASILRRAESLMLNELRFDPETRSDAISPLMRMAGLAAYADPQNPPIIPGWPTNA